jgi:hypothetical protein
MQIQAAGREVRNNPPYVRNRMLAPAQDRSIVGSGIRLGMLRQVPDLGLGEAKTPASSEALLTQTSPTNVPLYLVSNSKTIS